MNKKLIAMAVAAAFAAPAAMADVTVYGKVHASIDSIDNSDSSGTDAIQVNDRGSRLGFKGSEDLGNGLKAIFKYEMVYDVDEGAGTAGARNSYVGLSGGFGTFLVGRHDTPTKMAIYASGAEMGGDTIIQIAGNGDGTGLNMEENRADDAIAYVSPSFSGVKVAVAAIPGEATGTNDGIADSWSAAVMYSGHGAKFAAGTESIADTRDVWNIGGSYTFSNFTLAAIYQNQEADASDNESEMYAISGKAKFGNNTITAVYGNSENDFTTDQDGDLFGLMFTHSMSKRTKVYAAYASRDVDGDGSMDSVAGETMNDGSAFSIGMIHSF